MATMNAEAEDTLTITSQPEATAVRGLGQLSTFKQIGLMIGLAASVAVGVMIVMWSQTPAYTPLYTNLSGKAAQEVIDSLNNANISYKLNQNDGTIMIPGADIHKARIKLAAEGIPKNADMGFEVLSQEQGFGTSQFIEHARYQRALEIELARSVVSLNPVKNARVHLAIPKQTVFVRNRKKPSASVIVDLYQGRTLDQGQISAISFMVASGVPELEAGDVSIVDGRGKVLVKPGTNKLNSMSDSQYEYTQRLETDYQNRILSILKPILGDDSIEAQVTAIVDFTQVERTRESYNPDLPALRSEQLVEQSGSAATAAGIPGALSNQPPDTATTEGEQKTGVSGKKSSTRNFELDKTISHTVMPSTIISRLSVAVVIDDIKSINEDGSITRTARSLEEIDRISRLIKESVGFNEVRGDKVSVINTAFIDPEPLEALPELGFIEQPWIWDAGRQLIGLIAVLLIVFMVLRPAMKRLTNNDVLLKQVADKAALESAGGRGNDHLRLTNQSAGSGEGSAAAGEFDQEIEIPSTMARDKQIEVIKSVIDNDPRVAAQVVKSWVTEGE